MTSRALAIRYARALFDVALAESDPARVGEQLHQFAAIVAGHAELSKVLASPAVPKKIKAAILTDLVGQVTLESPLRKLLLMLADRDRLTLLTELDEAYQDRLLQHQQVIEAHVTTAAPLAPERADALARGLSEKTGRQVKLTTSVDPALLGGVVTRIGSTVYDGSVSRHLERLRQTLAQDA
jgi:F-type H+-transporting ATPase subunit delta